MNAKEQAMKRFPDGLPRTYPPMTLRQWYAGLAMAANLSNGLVDGTHKDIAQWAFLQADAMISESNKKMKNEK